MCSENELMVTEFLLRNRTPVFDMLRAENQRLRAAGTEIVRLAKSLDASDEEWDQAIDALVEALN